MADRRVFCSDKTDRSGAHERIRVIGGVHEFSPWNHTHEEAIAKIEQVLESYYVEQPPGHRVPVIVVTREGHKYLKTATDDEQPNNLLALPNCTNPRR